MTKAWLFAVIPGVLASIAGLFILALLLVKLLWAWTIPDLFPGAVERGFIAQSISWYAAFKVAVFISVLAGLAGARRGK